MGECGEAMVMAACFALLVAANNGEYGNVNFIHIQCISFSSFGPLQCTTSLPVVLQQAYTSTSTSTHSDTEATTLHYPWLLVAGFRAKEYFV